MSMPDAAGRDKTWPRHQPGNIDGMHEEAARKGMMLGDAGRSGALEMLV